MPWFSLCLCYQTSKHVFSLQPSIHTKKLSTQDSSALMQVDQNEASLAVKDEMQDEGFSQAESIICYSKVVKNIYPGDPLITMHVNNYGSHFSVNNFSRGVFSPSNRSFFCFCFLTPN